MRSHLSVTGPRPDFHSRSQSLRALVTALTPASRAATATAKTFAAPGVEDSVSYKVCSGSDELAAEDGRPRP
jgi:hypothetical protein